MRNKIILTTNPNSFAYSLESGLADNVCHFDHHKVEHAGYPCPANNPAIPVITGGEIAISHLDADTFLGILRFEGIEIPKGLNLELIEKIDLNGSSVCEDLSDPSYLYMVGIGETARSLGMPRNETGVDKDVTIVIQKIIDMGMDALIKTGREAQKKVEETFHKSKVVDAFGVGLFKVGEGMSFDPSFPYTKGIDVVVVHRTHYKTISIYVNPRKSFVARQTWAGIKFEGHEKACGSPRGIEMSEDDAISVYTEILAKITSGLTV